jgi:phosphorylcholine metabolism protein LicD
MKKHDTNILFSMRTLEERQHYTVAAKLFIDWFEKTFNLPVYLIYGSLIGACREHKLILHDYDIDIAYLSNETDIIKIEQEADYIEKTLENNNLIEKRCEPGHYHALSLDKEILLDLWTSWFTTDNKFYAIGAYDGTLGKEDILPFKNERFETDMFKIPSNFDKFLSAYYDNWKIPNGTEYTWTPVKKWVTFKNYLETYE